MKRLFFSVKQIIPILMLFVAGVSPLYGQESSVKTETSKLAGTVKRLTPEAQADATSATGSRFALSAGETPAVPVKRLTPEAQADANPATGSRFALSAGETPAVPVKRLTPALTAEADHANERIERNLGETASVQPFTFNARETPALPAKQNQTTTDPFVFPTRKERFDRYVKSMFGPKALLRSAIKAGINQWKDSPEEWEQGMSGYGKRFASSFGKNAIQQTVIYGLDSALGLDTRFRKSPSKKFGERLKHALLENITSRTKSGKRVISAPRIAGAYTSGVISREAWYPERYTWKDGLRSGNKSLLTGFALNVVREFVVNF